MELTGLHPVEATRLLQGLIRNGFLESHNPGRGAVYCLRGAALPRPEEVFGDGLGELPENSGYMPSSSTHLPGSSTHLPNSQPPLAAGNQGLRDPEGRLLSPQLDAPVIDTLQLLSSSLRGGLQSIAALPQAKPKISQEEMQSVLLALCTGHYVTGNVLAELVNRGAKALQQNYLRPLVQQGKLQFAFPTAPTHEMQAYRTTESE